MMPKCFDKNLANAIQDFFEHLRAQNTKNILFVFSPTEVMDSTGIGLLVNFQEEFSQQGFSLKLIAVSQKILHLFEILGLADFFQIYSSIQEALSSFFPEKEQAFFSSTAWEKEVVESSEPQQRENDSDFPDPAVIQTPMHVESLSTEAVQHTDAQKKSSTSEEIFAEDNSDKNPIVKRYHTIKIKKKPEDSKDGKLPYSVKIDYYSQMLVAQEFSLRIVVLGQAKKKDKSTWEIIPKLPGCLIVPCSISIHDAELPCEFFFSVVPLAPTHAHAELLIYNKHSPLRQFPLKIQVQTRLIPKLCILGAMLIFIGTVIFHSFEFPITLNPPFLIQLLHTIFFIFAGSCFGGFLWTSIFLFAGFFYERYRLKPQKSSTQIHFYEKDD